MAADAAAAEFGSLAALLRRHAAGRPEAPAYIVLSDRGHEESAITYAALYRDAAALAHRIAAQAAPGERALLLCPNGIGFMTGFFACMMAGVIAVPMMLPRRQSSRDASASIVADCTPCLALAPASLIEDGGGELVARIGRPGLGWLAVDAARDGAEPADADFAEPRPGDIAFLQYTSGSTAAPKGVMVSHANLLANLAMIRAAFGNTGRSTYVSWVPLYHDMGLIINALQSVFLGALCVLMRPVAFIQRPLLWLRAIGEYRAEVAGGPNFAFDLCVERYRPEQMAGVDLSGWKLAFNGAEPVRAETLRRFTETFAPHGFAAASFYPAYGMAEATVLISGGRRGAGPVVQAVSRVGLLRHRAEPPSPAEQAQEIVGCGRALPDERIAIVEPETRSRLQPGEVGEIWTSGPNVGRGYWNNSEASAATFGARIAGEDEGVWLRTGDLGFVDDAGELFITGRVKDMLIVRGANHYPQDIEETVQACHPGLSRHGGAAFAVGEPGAAERLVVVQEVERTYRRHIETEDLRARIRAAIVNEHEIVPHDIVLLRPGSLPKTTSGKIQRARARQLWLEGTLDRL